MLCLFVSGDILFVQKPNIPHQPQDCRAHIKFPCGFLKSHNLHSYSEPFYMRRSGGVTLFVVGSVHVLYCVYLIYKLKASLRVKTTSITRIPSEILYCIREDIKRLMYNLLLIHYGYQFVI